MMGRVALLAALALVVGGWSSTPASRTIGGLLEGFPSRNLYAVRTVAVGGELLEIIADLGPKPLDPNSFAKVNRVLATLRVQPPRVVRPRNGRLAADGVA